MMIVQFSRARHAARARHFLVVRALGSAGIADNTAANTPLQSLAGGSLAGRFHAWHGRSGQRYICSVFPASQHAPDAGLPDYADAVIIAVARDIDGVRKVVRVCQVEGDGGAGRAAFIAEALAVRAREWHVYLLATCAWQRGAVVADLEGRTVEPTSEA